MTIAGAVAIEPSLPLSEVAKIVSAALNIELAYDKDGKYEEYPAYFTEVLGIEISLCGPPDPAYDIRTVKSQDYELAFISMIDFAERVDISPYILELLQSKTSLTCRLP